MEIKTFESEVAPTEDAATASLNGLLNSLHKDGDFEIASMETREIEGVGWVATVVVHMLDPEPELEEDEEGSGETESGEESETPENDELVLLHGHEGLNDIPEESAAHALPDMEDPAMDTGFQPDIAEQTAPARERDDDSLGLLYGAEYKNTARDDIAKAAEESVESLSEEFQEVEMPQDQRETSDQRWEYAAIAEKSFERGEGIPPQSRIEIAELEDEEKRARFAAEMAERRAEGPAPDPAQSA